MDKGRPEADSLRALQVAIVGGDHHHFVRLQPQERRGRAVDFGIRLVVFCKLGREHTVPAEPAVPGHIHQQPHVAIGERGNDGAAAQPREPRGDIRPRVKPMPDPVELIFIVLGQTGNLVARQQVIQDQAVEGVDIHPGEVTAAHALHGRSISCPPFVCKLFPVDFHAFGGPNILAFPDD